MSLVRQTHYLKIFCCLSKLLEKLYYIEIKLKNIQSFIWSWGPLRVETKVLSLFWPDITAAFRGNSIPDTFFRGESLTGTCDIDITVTCYIKHFL